MVTAGAITVTGDSVFSGTITAGALTVTGESIFTGTVYATGGIVVSGYSTFANLAVTDLLVATVTLDNTEIFDATIGTLTVTGPSILNNAVTAGALYVTGESTFSGAVTAGGLAVTGASFFNNDMLITGGSLTVTGGSIVFNTVDVSPSMADIVKERSATIGNGQISAANIDTFAFDSAVARAFDAVVSVTITTSTTTGNKYAYYNLKGIQKVNTWVLNSSFVGDVTGLTFSISSAGQIQYTSTSVGNFTDGTVKFRALTTSV